MDRGQVFEETPRKHSGEIYKCEASIQSLSSCCVLKLCYRISIPASREVYDASSSLCMMTKQILAGKVLYTGNP